MRTVQLTARGRRDRGAVVGPSHRDPDLAVQYDLELAEIAFIRINFNFDTGFAALSSLVRPFPLHALAHLPRMPQEGKWYCIASIHWTRQERMVVVLRESPLTGTSRRHTGGHMVMYGGRVEVWDVAGMRLAMRVELPATTAFALGSGPAQVDTPTMDEAVARFLMLPAWHGEGGVGGPGIDAWVLDALAQSIDPSRKEDRGGDLVGTLPHEEGTVRHVHSPGTVLHVAPTCEGLAVVRSLGPMRGAVVEMCWYGRPQASVEGEM
ncbi:hypothetical protein GGF32_001093 [Allomyces javanicus]|nr:hypothetical protein GGF32_001093 [Allomyces javanicus]